MRQALDEADRDPGSFPIAKRIYIVVDDDAERGRERVNDAMARIYGRRIPVDRGGRCRRDPGGLHSRG